MSATNQAEIGLQSLNPSAITELMSSDGPTVRAVLLKSDGSMEEVMYDTTPRKNEIATILGAPPTIIGEWNELHVIIVGVRTDDLEQNSSLPEINKHKLRFPFHNKEFRGDLLLYRFDENAVAQHFSLSEYEAFVAKSDEDIGKKWVQPALSEEEDDNDDNDDNDNDDDNEEELFDMQFILKKTVERKIRKEFPLKFGREPSDEEVNEYVNQTLDMINNSQEMDDNEEEEDDDDDDDNEDEDYNPSADMEQFKKDEEEDICDPNQLEKEMEVEMEEEKNQINEENEEENEDIFENEEFQKEYAMAIQNAQQLAAHDRQKILQLAQMEYKKELGMEVPTDVLNEAFDLLKVKLMNNNVCDVIEECDEENEENEENEDYDMEQNDNNDNNDNDAKEEKENGLNDEVIDNILELNEAELKHELNLAFDNIRKLAKVHQRKLVESISETYQEINDRPPSVDELKNIFGRIREKFAEEAKEELLDDEDENDMNDVQCNFADMVNQKNNSLPAELRKAAQSVVLEDLKRSAMSTFMEKHNRKPNHEEFQSIMIELTKTKFSDLDLNNDEFDKNDEDYVPNEAELEQMANDEMEDFSDDHDQNEEDEDEDEDENESEDDEEEEEEDEEYVPTELEIQQMEEDENEDFSEAEDENMEEKEMEEMTQKQSVIHGNEEQKQDQKTEQVQVLTTPVKHRGQSSRVDIYLEDTDKEKSLKKAAKQFEKIHRRKADKADTEKLNAFLETGNKTLLNIEFEAEVDENEDNSNAQHASNQQ